MLNMCLCHGGPWCWHWVITHSYDWSWNIKTYHPFVWGSSHQAAHPLSHLFYHGFPSHTIQGAVQVIKLMDLFVFLTCLKDKRFEIVIKNVSIGGSFLVPTLSFSCSFWQKFSQIIVFPHLGGWCSPSGKSSIRHWLLSLKKFEQNEERQVTWALYCQ